MAHPIPFNRPCLIGKEFQYIQQAIQNGHLSGNGELTKLCERWLEQDFQSRRAFLVHSGTAALEIAALLGEFEPGDEIIMPSFTFTSTANAFVLRGLVPVFVDITRDTLTLDPAELEKALTPRTKAIVPVHYAGVACEMDAILKFAKDHRLFVIEDAAQGIRSTYKGKPLGSLGQLSAVSFHETKNVISGEGGALLINDPDLIDRAEYLVEKGTNRAKFLEGLVDKYTWVDVGSSYRPSEIIAAFLLSQLEGASRSTNHRLATWEKYHAAFASLEAEGLLRRPVIPPHTIHNAHMYYLLLPSSEARTEFLSKSRKRGVDAVFHYVPLHSSPAGRKFGRSVGQLKNTDELSARLVRLPLWPEIGGLADRVIEITREEVSALKTTLPSTARMSETWLRP